MEAHKPLTIEEIEASMRPGKLSLVGFLGTEERLAEVLELDDETVRSMSLTHDQISDKMIYYSNLRLNLFKTKTQRFIKGDYDPLGAPPAGPDAFLHWRCVWTGESDYRDPLSVITLEEAFYRLFFRCY